jgi:hypothetical protein
MKGQGLQGRIWNSIRSAALSRLFRGIHHHQATEHLEASPALQANDPPSLLGQTSNHSQYAAHQRRPRFPRHCHDGRCRSHRGARPRSPHTAPGVAMQPTRQDCLLHPHSWGNALQSPRGGRRVRRRQILLPRQLGQCTSGLHRVPCLPIERYLTSFGPCFNRTETFSSARSSTLAAPSSASVNLKMNDDIAVLCLTCGVGGRASLWDIEVEVLRWDVVFGCFLSSLVHSFSPLGFGV